MDVRAEREEGGGEVLLYHEVQESRLCAVHCINSALQGPYFTEVDLAALAADLDQRERQMMLEGGLGEESPAYLRFMAEDSSNVAADGNFSIQVLKSALEVWNLQCVSLDSDSAEAHQARAQPEQQAAFICHLEAHWFAIRKVASEWYNFNSLYPAPLHLSAFYLAAYLDTLKADGWSIFLVHGNLPAPAPAPSPSAADPHAFGRWLSPQQARQAHRDWDQRRSQEQQQQDQEQQQLDAAIAASLKDSSSSSLQSPAPQLPPTPAADAAEDEERDLAAAIAASLSESAPPDPAALARALAQSFYSAAGHLPPPP